MNGTDTSTTTMSEWLADFKRSARARRAQQVATKHRKRVVLLRIAIADQRRREAARRRHEEEERQAAREPLPKPHEKLTLRRLMRIRRMAGAPIDDESPPTAGKYGAEAALGHSPAHGDSHPPHSTVESTPQSGAIPDGATDGSETSAKGVRNGVAVYPVSRGDVETPIESTVCEIAEM